MRSTATTKPRPPSTRRGRGQRKYRASPIRPSAAIGHPHYPADDVTLVRTGLALLLAGAGIAVYVQTANGSALLPLVADERLDVPTVGIRVPPTHSDQGRVAAREVREDSQETGVLLPSQHVELRYAGMVLTEQRDWMGNLLKERASDNADVIGALHRLTNDACVLEPMFVSQQRHRRRVDSAADLLSAREREVLAAMAEGRSNAGIAHQLFISERTVESMSAHIFTKLGLEQSPNDNRRVLAVLQALRHSGRRTSSDSAR